MSTLSPGSSLEPTSPLALPAPSPLGSYTSPPAALAPSSPPPPPPDAPAPSPVPATPSSDPNSTVPPPPPQLPPLPGRGLPPATLAGLIIGIVIGVLFVLVGVGCYRRKKRKRRQYGLENHPGAGGPPQGLKATPPSGFSPSSQSESSVQAPMLSMAPSSSFPLGFSQSAFTYEELAGATDGFSNANLLGQGGYGYVHKGVLTTGKVVAVKQLKAGSGQGEREFRAEVEIISRIHHRHLVSLVGYCISGEQRMLVYEFVPNNTLEFHLHGKDRPTMSWPIRMRIALGSAKGLAYLHEDCQPKVIHRDIKAANILLDFSFEAKVADFGLAKFSEDTETHISTRVMGTFGYMAPEYASSGKLTEKSDVFSFGVVLLELITGRRPIDKARPFADDSMFDWARPLLAKALEDNDFEALADPRLEKNYDSSEMARMIACAAASIRHSARHRPKMSQIVRALEGNLALHDLNDGVQPGHSRAYSPFGRSDYSSGQYQEDLKMFRKMALEGREITTSEYSASGPTSESGAQPSHSSSETPRSAEETESGN
ncbi:proline-rich receptor-like protein kinase PERK15 [Punica granatum]|uniref:non-specific serine/threonine protein kinase n=1 Tax=Punica granatum TaxID=22663 RepID=A0A218WUY6_PUNGR|nr:proline-rich receptor-like protein kinase PERK15 [Punica granatum]OWM76483.1 hypothetical protein CDL15_Pgr005447 [Punica granatum]